jgi:hypothetical protein
MNLARPQAGEFAPYAEKYISLVPDDVLSALEQQAKQTVQLYSDRQETEGDFRYEPNKWSAKEVLGHITDTERIFTYRALRAARRDRTPMEGFEQDDYVRDGGFGQRTLKSLLEEYQSVRAASITLFRSFSGDTWTARSVANKHEISVRALAFMTAGHELHHVKILRERYFPLRRHA